MHRSCASSTGTPPSVVMGWMRERHPGADVLSLFPGASDAAVRCRAIDWNATPLGPTTKWSPALRLVVRTAMECPFPVNLWCGEDKILIYNDGYRALLDARHPRALGRPGHDVWADSWPDVEAMFASVARGECVHAEDQHSLVGRADGPAADAWFTFSLSPVRDEEGGIVAFLNVATETTQRVHTEGEMRAAKASAERAEQRLREVFTQAPGFAYTAALPPVGVDLKPQASNLATSPSHASTCR